VLRRDGAALGPADAGKAFDPELVEIFLERFDRIREIWRRHPDLSRPRA